jgi:hypothetical protein
VQIIAEGCSRAAQLEPVSDPPLSTHCSSSRHPTRAVRRSSESGEASNLLHASERWGIVSIYQGYHHQGYQYVSGPQRMAAATRLEAAQTEPVDDIGSVPCPPAMPAPERNDAPASLRSASLRSARVVALLMCRWMLGTIEHRCEVTVLVKPLPESPF